MTYVGSYNRWCNKFSYNKYRSRWTQFHKIDKSLSISDNTSIHQKEKSSSISENTSIINTEEEKREDTTDVIANNCTVQIPSMFKIQMILDNIYLGESTSSTNMSLKIMKKPKVVHKRKKEHKALQKVSKDRNKHKKLLNM